ncbi:MAG: serine hydrolase, partial [Acidimicrobiia bacterium]
ELMISISDNTATDLLIDLLGRNVVEAAQTAYGHTQPGLNAPFLTTREWAILKLGPEQQREDYLNADEAGRRAILDGLADVPASSLAGEAFLQPIVPDRLEWFASLNDLCAVHVRLQEKAQVSGLEPVAEILSLNPGIPSETWDYIGFKGGSEPGLVATSWLVTEGERTFVLAAAVLDPEQPLDETEAVLLMGAARDLLGSQ